MTLDFATTHARTTDPETSKQAASVVKVKASTHRAEILLLLRNSSEPLHYKEIAARTGIDETEVGRRISDLDKSGDIIECGKAPLPPHYRTKGRTWRAT